MGRYTPRRQPSRRPRECDLCGRLAYDAAPAIALLDGRFQDVLRCRDRARCAAARQIGLVGLV